MDISRAQWEHRLRHPETQKFLKYSAASAVSVVISVLCLVFFDAVLHWGAVLASTAATAIATLPSYHLNRKWAWGKHGPSHVWREVVPFWALAFAGWAFSTYSVQLTENAIGRHHSLFGTALIALVYIGAFGVLWIVKFFVLNKLLFTHAQPGEHAEHQHQPEHLHSPDGGGHPAKAGSVDGPDGKGPQSQVSIDAA